MKLKLEKKPPRENFCLRLSESERNQIAQKAMTYGVALSEWIRFAAINFVPKKRDIE